MKSASERRAQTSGQRLDAVLNDIDERLERAAKNGQYHANIPVDGSLLTSILDKLHSLGYTAFENNRGNGKVVLRVEW